MDYHEIPSRVGDLSLSPDMIVNPEWFEFCGEYNPHKLRAWIIGADYGALAIVWASDQDAIDAAVDGGKFNSLAMDPSDYEDYRSKGWDDSYILAGNASEPFWSEYLWVVEYPADDSWLMEQCERMTDND